MQKLEDWTGFPARNAVKYYYDEDKKLNVIKRKLIRYIVCAYASRIKDCGLLQHKIHFQ